ncbi:MAG TPA: hypothetical protein PKD10_08015 [Paracoccaceae bacterium]|nr:hypothetical protein [Paracoccaceae bacterium]
MPALKMATAIRRPSPGCIHHTGRYTHCCAHDQKELLHQSGFRVSMRGKGMCFGTCAIESLFKSLKAEQVWRRNGQSLRDGKAALFEYVNGFSGPRNIHSTLGWTSPLAFEPWATWHAHPAGTEPVQVHGPPWAPHRIPARSAAADHIAAGRATAAPQCLRDQMSMRRRAASQLASAMAPAVARQSGSPPI